MKDYIAFLKAEISQKKHEIQEKDKIINIFVNNNKDTLDSNHVETRPATKSNILQSNVINSSHSATHSDNNADNYTNYGSNKHSTLSTNDQLVYNNYEKDDVMPFAGPSNKFQWVTERRKAKKSRTIANKPRIESFNRFQDLQLRDNNETKNYDISKEVISDDDDDNTVSDNRTERVRSNLNSGSKSKAKLLVNNSPENDVFSYNRNRKWVVPGNKTYTTATQGSKQICIFGDSIPQRLRIKDFNEELCSSHAFKKIFPGGTTEELRHYISKTLTDNQLDYYKCWFEQPS